MATKKPPQAKLAILKINFNSYAMPVDDATKVIALMKGATLLGYSSSSASRYKADERDFELAMEVVGKNAIG